MRKLWQALLAFGLPCVAYACPTCGAAQTFERKTLAITLGFAALPLLIIATIGWRVWKAASPNTLPKSKGFATPMPPKN